MSAPVFAPFGATHAMLATAGIAAIDPVTLQPLSNDFETQARWVLDRLDHVLAEAGTTRAHLLRIECFLADRTWFHPWNIIYAEHFAMTPPPRTTLVCTLPVEGLLIEVQAIAAIP